MSSSESGVIASLDSFRPDVPTVGRTEFVPEAVAMRAPRVEADHPKDMDEFRAGPTEEELRAQFQAEMREQLQSELQRLRQEDGASFTQLAEGIRRANEERIEDISRRALELSIAVAERLFRDRIDRDPEVIERVLRDVLRKIDVGTGVIVHAHPDDASYLRAHEDVLRELGVAKVVDDPRQRRGGCLIDADSAGWDATVITQLSALHGAIDRVLESS